MRKLIVNISSIHPELIIWPGALLFLAFTHPANDEHFTFCVFRLLGFEACPGCGLGHAISYLLHGEFAASWEAHPLGFAAVLILSYRVITLSIKELSKYQISENLKWLKSSK